MRKEDLIFGLALLLFGYSCYVSRKAQYVAGKIDKTIDEVARDTTISVDDEIIRAAVDRNIKKHLDLAIKDECKRAVAKVGNDIHDQVKAAVQENYKDISLEVKHKIEDQVGHIDISDVKRTVIREAKESAVEKFNDDLDVVLNDYNKQLSNVTKIYSNIADVIGQRNDSRQMVFKM